MPKGRCRLPWLSATHIDRSWFCPQPQGSGTVSLRCLPLPQPSGRGVCIPELPRGPSSASVTAQGWGWR